jgi:hypothetical protein
VAGGEDKYAAPLVAMKREVGDDNDDVVVVVEVAAPVAVRRIADGANADE